MNLLKRTNNIRYASNELSINEVIEYIQTEYPEITLGHETYDNLNDGKYKVILFNNKRLKIILPGKFSIKRDLSKWDGKLLAIFDTEQDQQTVEALNCIETIVRDKFEEAILHPIVWMSDDEDNPVPMTKFRIPYTKKDMKLSYVEISRLDGGGNIKTIEDIPIVFEGGVVVQLETLFILSPKKRDSEIRLNFKVMGIEVEEVLIERNSTMFSRFRKAGKYEGRGNKDIYTLDI
eukprot:TRINITY_DN9030_c0_g1_i1.p1 TRINITY_DN9030_c0_g1~~TRINITY_DN9030_c0_g1_i1.p1  ORF type:complete len:234 (-),score=40.87 TRINITY_DN9030_c0_g1_i1:267-968(-)